MGSRRPAVLVALGAACALAAAMTGWTATGSPTATGGTLRLFSPSDVDSLDPGLATGRLAWVLLAGTCMTLMSYRDEGPARYELRPEAAAGPPQVSRDGLTYVFTLRKSLRFSDGSPLTAANFARAFGRILNPKMLSYGAALFPDVKAVTRQGRLRLRIVLSKPAGDLLTRLALSFTCPVPLGFPVDPAGVPLMVGSGPYAVAEYVPGKLLVFRRNSYYSGPRQRRVDRVEMTIGGDVSDGIRAVEAGQSDILAAEILVDREELARRYGLNKRQLFRTSGTNIAFVAMNTSRPLFRDNVELRKAVNLALDREAIAAVAGPAWRLSGTTTDQLVPRWVPGWVDRRIYPVARPDLRAARALAAGNLRDKKAMLYTSAVPLLAERAKLVAANLRELGLEVEVKALAPAVLDARAGTPGEPYDLVLTRYFVEYPDPANVLIRLLARENARRSAGNTNFSYFDNAAYNQRMAATQRLTGTARLKAFSTLEADILRNEAPVAPLSEGSYWMLVSKRVGCVRPDPARLAWWAVCLQ